MAKSYAIQFYQSKQWRTVRKQILYSAGYTCQECNRSRATEVHHKTAITPNNIADDNITLNPDNLMALCHSCHDKITKGFGDLASGYVFDENGNVVQG